MPQNLERLGAALIELDARLRGAEEGVPVVVDARSFAAGDHFTCTTIAGDLDCLGTPAGTSGFDDLAANAAELDVDGMTVLVAAVEDLIRMKRAAGRAKDRAELEILGALRDVLEEGGES